jgi:probable F420-dependent oxidoreductase
MAASPLTFGVSMGDDDRYVCEFAQQAEALGFDRISMGEHVMDGKPPRPTTLALPVAAAAAGATRNLRVMTGIVIAPLYHPVLLAKLVTTVDLISNGRLDFGIGISGQRETRVEFAAVGVPVQTRGHRTNEMLSVMKRLWTEEHVTHHGDFFAFEDVTLVPQPIQQPHPPIWVAGRSEAAMRRAALLGDGWYPYLFTVRRLRSSNETVRQYATEAGRDLSGFHWGVVQPTAIADDKQEALALAVTNLGQRYVTPDRSAKDIAQALCLTGTPQDCIAGIEARIEAGVREFTLGFLAANDKDRLRQIELFAKQVMPYFRKSA